MCTKNEPFEVNGETSLIELDGEELELCVRFPNIEPFIGGFRYPATTPSGPWVRIKRSENNRTIQVMFFDTLILSMVVRFFLFPEKENVDE